MNSREKLKTIETIILKVEILTPLHIGDGTRLTSGYDFLLHQGNAYVFDGAEVCTQKMEKNPYLELGKTLDHYLSADEYLSMALYHYTLSHHPREIFPHTKTTGRVYLPGSSLKGSLRTAFLAGLLKKKNVNLLQLEWAPNKRYAAAPIERRYLGANPNEDIFKGLRVRDSKPFSPERLSAVEAMSFHLRGNGMREMGPEYCWTVEAIKPGTILDTELSIDLYALNPPRNAARFDRRRQDYMKKIRERSSLILNDLFRTSSIAVEELIAGEKKFFREHDMDDVADFYEALEQAFSGESPSTNMFLPLGWGAGWRSKTLGILDLDERVLKDIQRRYRLGHSNASEFPLTRRLAVDRKGNRKPFGWVKLMI